MPTSPEQSATSQPHLDLDNQALLASPNSPVRYFLDTNRVRYAGRFVHQLDEPIEVRSPQEVGEFLRNQVYHPWEAFTQEEMYGLALNSRCEITHSYLIYRGTIDLIAVRPAEVFRPALLLNAMDIILSHNHPANDPNPSTEDITATQDIIVAGNALGIHLIDHMIVGQDACVSLKERGLGTDPRAGNSFSTLRAEPWMK